MKPFSPNSPKMLSPSITAVMRSARPKIPAGMKEKVEQLLDNWMEAFNNKDMEGWSNTHNFPHVRIAGGQVSLWETKDDYISHFSKPDMFKSLEAAGWHHSKWVSRDFDLVSEEKVHVSVVFQRYDKENNPHSKFEALYVVTKINSHWGVQARSSLAP